jgi:uncharacterized protein
MVTAEIAPALAEKLARLERTLAAYPTALVALSGGVDSTFLLRAAHGVLGARLTALTTVSPTNPLEDTETAVAIARELGVEHVIVEANELEIPHYAANPIDRCYFCKHNLYEICSAEAARRDIAVIADGVNTDDLGDYRPGLRAADEQRVRHPLAEAGLAKEDLRVLSRALGLRTWDKPASPCLSSRFPYGTAITLERLQMVSRAEDTLRALGFRDVRVRFHGEVARIEVGTVELARFAEPDLRRSAVEGIRAAGFRHVTLDLEGFRSGSLNESIASDRPAGPAPTTK